MAYLDHTDAELVALTRERRRERLLTAYMAPMPDMNDVRVAYRRLHGEPLPEKPCIRFSTRDACFKPITYVHSDHGGDVKLRSVGRHQRERAERVEIAKRYHKPDERDHGKMASRPFRTLWSLQDGKCYLCRKAFTVEDWATLDHVVPKAVGGGDAGNILLACGACNNRKGNRGPKPCENLFMTYVNTRFVEVFESLEDT